MSENQSTRQYIVSEQAVRRAFVLGGVGMVAVILALLVLITSRPQGQLRALDDSQHQARLADAEASLSGFELRDDGSARIDIDHAMQLVVERGVDLRLGQSAAAADGASADDASADDDATAVSMDVDGEAIYVAQCAACHQASGAGVPGAFPPLAGHVGDLYAADRDYLPAVLVAGLMGPIDVGGTTYNGMMPAFAQLGDAEIAAVLNHTLVAWGDADELGDEFSAFVGDDVEAQRARGLSMADVHELRLALTLD